MRRQRWNEKKNKRPSLVALVPGFPPPPGGKSGWGRGEVICCLPLSHLTIDHESLSRRNTVPTPKRDDSNIWTLTTLLLYTTSKLFAYILSPFCFAVCSHRLSPRIAIVFSLLSSPPSSSMSHPSISSSPLLVHPVPPCIFHILLLCESYSLLLCHTGTYL